MALKAIFGNGNFIGAMVKYGPTPTKLGYMIYVALKKGQANLNSFNILRSIQVGPEPIF